MDKPKHTSENISKLTNDMVNAMLWSELRDIVTGQLYFALSDDKEKFEQAWESQYDDTPEYEKDDGAEQATIEEVWQEDCGPGVEQYDDDAEAAHHALTGD